MERLRDELKGHINPLDVGLDFSGSKSMAWNFVGLKTVRRQWWNESIFSQYPLPLDGCHWLFSVF